jgi:hypothetical protein
MTMGGSSIAVGLTRAWVRLYTCHAPAHIAAARRAEIESDLWEMQHDADLPSGRRGAMAAARLLAGIPDDLAWCFDNAPAEEQLLLRRAFALTVATVLVVSLWTVPSLLFSGRQEVADCAASATPQTNADFRLEAMRCAGAFFSSAR